MDHVRAFDTALERLLRAHRATLDSIGIWSIPAARLGSLEDAMAQHMHASGIGGRFRTDPPCGGLVWIHGDFTGGGSSHCLRLL